MLGQHLAEGIPIPCLLHLRETVALYPADQGLHVPGPLHVDGHRWPSLCPGNMVVRRKPERLLKLGAGAGQRPEIPERFMDCQFFRVDFVDSDVKMHIFRIVMHNRKPLVFAVTKLLTNVLFYFGQCLRRRALSLTEAHNKMVGLVPLCPDVLLLYRQHLHSRPSCVLRLTSRHAHFPNPAAAPLRVGQVGNQPGNAAFRGGVHAHTTGNHC